MKGFWKLDWLKWLPMISNVLFLISFCYLINKYQRIYFSGKTAFHRSEMLFWGDFFSGAVSITLVVAVVCSFFIKNKWLKWLSVITGIATLVAIYYNVGKFNPY